MKRILAIVAALAVSTVALAAPAQADSLDRTVIASVVEQVLYDLPSDELDTACWGWHHLPHRLIYSELVPTVMDNGHSRYDATIGIKRAFDRVC